MKKYFVQVSEETTTLHRTLKDMGYMGRYLAHHEIEGSTPEEVIEKLAEHFGIKVVIVPFINQSGAV